MPNWVFNGLNVEGPTDLVNDMVRQLNRPFVYNVQADGDLAFHEESVIYSEPVFAFHNIYNHRQDGISDEDYAKQPPRSTLDISDPNWWADTRAISDVDSSWYNWNNRNWGTKWEVAVRDGDKYSDTYMEEHVNNEDGTSFVYYNFHTAWSPPMPAIVKLSQQYPTLKFTLSYEEEQGWGGEVEILNGEINQLEEYEDKCRNCEEINCLEYCDECGDNVCSGCNYGAGEECQTHKEKVEA